MVCEQSADSNVLTIFLTALHHLMRTDPDPRVRHRAHALSLVAQG